MQNSLKNNAVWYITINISIMIGIKEYIFMEMKLYSSPKRKTEKKWKMGLGIAAGVVVLLLGAYAVVGVTVFNERFMPGTVIDGIDCSMTDAEGAKAALETVIDGYSLKITDGKNDDVISAGDIKLKGDFEGELTSALKAQKKLLWGAGLFRKNDIETAPVVEFDEEALNNKISTLILISGQQVTDSVNAYLKLNEGNKFEVVPEVYGTRLDRERFTERIVNAVNSLEKSLDLTKEDLYIKPTVYKDNEGMINAMNTANKWLDSEITYKFGSNTEVLKAETFKDWIIINDKFEAYFNRDMVKEFVRSLSRKYDTFGDTRTFPTSYGFSVGVVGGNYGYRINREAEIDNLVADIKSGEKKQRKPDYYQEGAGYDGLDIGSTYVEVDLTGQHLFLYKDGKMVLHTEMVSGNPSKGSTPNGTYRITYCERDATLRGEDYETPVAYWMPFNGDIGLHDATWQPKFGGDWYVRHGSHGCINLPLSMAAQIYSYAYKGMPVVCYRYGTESYNKVEAYRKGAGLPAIFDVQPETEPTSQTTTAAQA